MYKKLFSVQNYSYTKKHICKRNYFLCLNVWAMNEWVLDFFFLTITTYLDAFVARVVLVVQAIKIIWGSSTLELDMQGGKSLLAFLRPSLLLAAILKTKFFFYSTINLEWMLNLKEVQNTFMGRKGGGTRGDEDYHLWTHKGGCS